MDTNFGCKPRIPRLIDLVREREIRDSTARKLASKRDVTKDLIYRLGLEKELEGHVGCVNCLQWSDNGQILASASDDMHIILWNPFTYKKLHSFNTGHTANIFTVNFMPKTNNSIVISGAGDDRVKVFNFTLSELLYNCACHTARVKRVATTENTPYLFWSAAEDGFILQHDLRTPHTCAPERRTILVDLIYHIGHTAEAKCLAINPMRPELMAVGANDPYIRMYDRRMIKLKQGPVETFPGETDQSQDDSTPTTKDESNENIPPESAQYFIAGHLRSPKRNLAGNIAATYVTFSGDGTELLANMGGSHIYLFDIVQPRQNKLFNMPVNPTGDSNSVEAVEQLRCSAYGTDPKNVKDYTSVNVKVLSPYVESLKLKGNKMFGLEEHATAINLYNKALGICPMAAVLYGNRSAAYMKRNWDGDDYAALRDCQTTLLLDPEHVKARFRLARCLFQLDRPHEAFRVIEDFQDKFPDYTSNASYRALKKSISEAVLGSANHTESTGWERSQQSLSTYEKIWRGRTIDYNLRYCGHCNTTTDIKEANFFGSDGQYIIAGSDDAKIFIWDRYTTNIVRVLWGDSKIVNCLQPHPSSCFLATSGIDTVVRLWSPLPEDDKPNQRAITNTEDLVILNQIRMRTDPLTIMLHQYHYTNGIYSYDQPEPVDVVDPVSYRRTCRPS